MHHSELFAALYKAWPDKAQLPARITEMLRTDKAKRFVCLGRSGCWALARWKNIEPQIVANAAEAVLRRRGPLSARALFTKILRRRPLSFGFLKHELRTDPRFRKTSENRWTLR